MTLQYCTFHLDLDVPARTTSLSDASDKLFLCQITEAVRDGASQALITREHDKPPRPPTSKPQQFHGSTWLPPPAVASTSHGITHYTLILLQQFYDRSTSRLYAACTAKSKLRDNAMLAFQIRTRGCPRQCTGKPDDPKLLIPEVP